MRQSFLINQIVLHVRIALVGCQVTDEKERRSVDVQSRINTNEFMIDHCYGSTNRSAANRSVAC